MEMRYRMNDIDLARSATNLGADACARLATIENQFRNFFRDTLRDSAISIASVAAHLNMGERNLQRILAGKYRLTATMLVDLAQVLEIDMGRAWVAIALFGDLRHYDDPILVVAVDLIGPLVDSIRRDLQTPLEPLHPKATTQLSQWIADTVIEHQRQLCARREALEIHRQI